MPLSQFQSLSQLIDQLVEAICVVDKSGNFLFVSHGAERVFGYKPEEMMQHNMLEFIHPDDQERTLSTVKDIMAGQEKFDFENRYIRKDGSVVHILWSARWSEQEQVRIAVARDITPNKLLLEQLQHLAFYDVLTGLPNRALLMDRLQQAVARCRRENRGMALCFIDLNKFKAINDEFGHACGDKVLIQAAAQLRSVLRETDTVARLGGDEFVVLLDSDSADDLQQVLEKLQRVLCFQVGFEQQQREITASIGVALFPADASSPEQLLSLADLAMYKAKQQQLPLYFYQQDHQAP